MFGIFQSNPVLSIEDTEFQINTYKWLLGNFGGINFFDETQLILPTEKFFPASVDNENSAAIETFTAVKKHAGMEDWPCQLEAQDKDINPLLAPATALENTPRTPLGTFIAKDNNEVVITYNPDLVNDPERMVAIFAHEIAHYLTITADEEPPGGWDNWGFATDIAATFLGFGLFMSNTAFNFQQVSEFDQQGFTSSRSGYLCEAEHIFALAIFLELKGIPYSEVSPHLKPGLKGLLKKALKQVSDAGLAAELMNIECKVSAPRASEAASTTLPKNI